MNTRLEFANVRALKHALKNIPNKMKTRELSKVARAGSTPVVKMAKRIAPIGRGLRPNGSQREHMKDTIDKKVRGYKASGKAVAIIGHRSRSTPHAHLVHEGTKPHTITVGVRTDPRGKKTPSIGKSGYPPRSLSNGRRFFGKSVRHPGATAFPYLTKALDRSRGESLRKMALKTRQILEKLAKEG